MTEQLIVHGQPFLSERAMVVLWYALGGTEAGLPDGWEPNPELVSRLSSAKLLQTHGCGNQTVKIIADWLACFYLKLAVPPDPPPQPEPVPEPPRRFELTTHAERTLRFAFNVMPGFRWEPDPAMVAQLCKAELTLIPGCGAHTIRVIETWLAQFDLRLSDAPRQNVRPPHAPSTTPTAEDRELRWRCLQLALEQWPEESDLEMLDAAGLYYDFIMGMRRPPN